MGPQQLPFELVTAVLEHLSQKDLRRASSVSRVLYNAAQDAGLYIHRAIDFGIGYKRSQAIEALVALVHYAKSKPNGPGLALTLFCATTKTFNEGIQGFLPTLTAALPVLVYLSVSAPAECSCALYAALCHPAPRLRVLALRQSNDVPADPQSQSIPQDLFANSARRLREVFLSVRFLSDVLPEPIPAFHRVWRANLELWRTGPRLKPALLFPHIRALWLDVITPCDNDGSSPDTVVDLGGLQLDHLSISQHLLPIVRSEAPLRHLRYVEQLGKLPWNETLWPEDATRGGFHAHFTRASRPVRFSFGPASGAWTRAICPWSRDAHANVLLRSLTLLGARLVKLTVHNMYLPDFLHCKVTLDALSELAVDLTNYCWVSHHKLRVSPVHGRGARCPALNTLSFLSADAKGETGTESVVSLARALGLAVRADSTGAFAVLQLIGVSFVPFVKREPIRRIFADIREGVAFTAAVAEQYYRGAGEGSDLDVTNPFSTLRDPGAGV